MARESGDADQTRRLLSLAAIYYSASRAEAAGIGGVGLQIVRDRGERFTSSGLSGLARRKAPGNRAKLNNAQRGAAG